MNTEIESRCPECGCDVRQDHERKFSCTRDPKHYSISMGGPGSGWSAASGHTKGSQGGGQSSDAHANAAQAHKEAARVHERAAQAKTGATHGGYDQAMATRDREVAATSALAHAATKDTGSKPYEGEAAKAYEKLAREASTHDQAAKYHQEAAKYHRGAAKRHESMVKK